MNENLSYNGVVTLIHRVNNKEVSKKYYNNGTIHLFEAYARALCGQSITRFLPYSLDVGVTKEGKFESKVRNDVTIPVFTTYKDGGADGGEYSDVDNTNVPYCRVSVTMFADMFSDINTTDALTIILKSKGDHTLAKADVNGLATAIADTNSGIQLLLLWDLYIKNGGNY